MKRKMKIKEFLTRKKVAAGCVAAAAVIAAGSFSMVMQSSDIPELSSYTDPVIETTITGDDTPLAKGNNEDKKKDEDNEKESKTEKSIEEVIHQKTSKKEKNNYQNQEEW